VDMIVKTKTDICKTWSHDIATCAQW